VARTLPPVPWRRAVRRARRSVALRWLLVVVAAGAVAVEGARIGADATAEREAWGTSVDVVVVRRRVAAGDPIRSGDVGLEPWPAALVPDDAVHAVPGGAVASAALVPGEALVSSRVAPAGIGPVAARVPAGWRAVAVPTSASGLGPPAPPLEVGDRVDLLAPDPVAVAAVVVAVDDSSVTVAVPADDATAVAEALAATVVTVVLRGPA
jgi:Flp pilus assembly protein CpaB